MIRAVKHFSVKSLALFSMVLAPKEGGYDPANISPGEKSSVVTA